LARLLAEKRGVRNRVSLPRLTVKKILAWADAHHRRTGRWPTCESGAIAGSNGETWSAVNAALSLGHRGLPEGSSLARLLAEKCGVRNRACLPRLTVKNILGWADAHHRRTGRWPGHKSGVIAGGNGEKWSAVETALSQGHRGLPGGSSLARLLAEKRGVRNRASLPQVTIKNILGWADAHHQRTGVWPSVQSGPVADAPGETWRAIDNALRNGRRGFRPGSSLSRLLDNYRRVARRGSR